MTGATEVNTDLHRTIRQLVGFIADHEHATGGLGAPWFRGQADRGWPLQPGVFREKFATAASNNFPALAAALKGDIARRPTFAVERIMNAAFQREAARFLSPSNDPIETYLQAQHYGLPTRLLDWTTDPLIALFFACITEPMSDGRLSIFTPYGYYYYTLMEELPQERKVTSRVCFTATPVKGYHEAFIGQVYGLFGDSYPKPVVPADGPDDNLRSLAEASEGRLVLPDGGRHVVLPVTPGLSFERLATQQGCFTFHTDETNTFSPLGFFDIPAQEKHAILEDLRRLGVTWARVYPDLDGVARALRSRYAE